MYNNRDELKALIASKLSIEEILDILGWTNIELVDAIEEVIMEQADDFQEAVDG